MRTFNLLTGIFALAATAVAQPVLNQGGIVNAASYSTDIAAGSIFVGFGSAMGPAALVQNARLPLQTSLSNTSISFTPTSGGSAIQALMIYTSAGQIAGLLPSGTAPGSYNATVTYNGQTSAPVQVTVVARNFGFVTQSSSGAGPAQATYGGYDLNRFTTGSLSFGGHSWKLHPAQEGNEVILWGTGGGADSKSDLNGGSSGDQTAAGGFVVNIGGMDVKPDYVGRSQGDPGLDQINFKVPKGITPDCFSNLEVRGNGFTSNIGTLAIAASGQSDCTHPTLSSAELSILDLGGTLVVGGLDLLKSDSELNIAGMSIDSKSETAFGTFSKYTVDTVATAPFSLAQSGVCYVYHRTGTAQQVAQGSAPQLLNAGNQLTLNGPGAANVAMKMIAPGTFSYYDTLYSNGFQGIGGTGTPTLAEGTYTISGTGGPDIGAFQASIDFPGSFTWTNQASVPNPIPRSSDLVINWSGGGSGFVAITGISEAQTGGTKQNPIYDAGLFTCLPPASAGTFTVSSSILGQLPQVTVSADGTSLGILSVSAIPNPAQSTFSAPTPLTKSGMIDRGFIGYEIGSSITTGWN